jgi:perosamine synthetase
MGCFSLYATKNIMCGEGGIITTNNESYVTALKQFRQHGMAAPYEYVDIGFNYRMSDLHAAIAVEQIKKADSFNQRRQYNAKQLLHGLRGIKGLVLPEGAHDRSHVYHQFTVRVQEGFRLGRDKLAEELRRLGVGVGIYYPKSLHLIPHVAAFGYKPGDFPEAELASSEVLSLPIHQAVSDADLKHIIKSVKELAHV